MDVTLTRIQGQSAAEAIRVTQHAQEEMDAEEITKEIEMKCSIDGCPGEYEHREVVHTVHQGDRIIVIDHVPAEVCTICGDVLFTPETVRRIESLRPTATPPLRTVPLYDFTQAKSAKEG
jgi:YgiT-type zinc finger domain-containing protein